MSAREPGLELAPRVATIKTAKSSATMREAVEVAGAVEVAARLLCFAGTWRCPPGKPR